MNGVHTNVLPTRMKSQTGARKNQELFLLALRVLSYFDEGIQPSADDLVQLAATLPKEQRSLPVDELACAIIWRELGARSPHQRTI